MYMYNVNVHVINNVHKKRLQIKFYKEIYLQEVVYSFCHTVHTDYYQM